MTGVNPHELAAYALLLAHEAGDSAAAARIASLSPADLAALIAEGGGGDDPADSFPGTT